MCDRAYMLASGNFENSQNLDILPDNIRRRRSISVKEKLDILNLVDSGCKLSAVARQYGISLSTASTINKERHKIKMLSDHCNIDPDRKRMRLGTYRDVDEAVHMWFSQQRMKNIPINGPLLQQKAREFALQLGHKTFEGTKGWLFRFRDKHGLTAKAMREKEDGSNACCSGIGMTDEEIVNSVSQNSAHLNFPDKNSEKQIPENYLVPDIELSEHTAETNHSESTTEIYNCGPIVEYNNSELSAEVNHNESSDSIPSVKCIKSEPEYNNAECIVTYDNSISIEYDCKPSLEYDTTVGFSASGSPLNIHDAILLTEKLTSFLKEHDVPSNILKSMNNVSNFIEINLREQVKQRKITDYFKS